jgi:hypothetical protein
MMAMIEVIGYVWCDNHGIVHEDTLNPNGYIEGQADICRPEHHHPMFRANPDLQLVNEYSGFDAEQFLDRQPLERIANALERIIGDIADGTGFVRIVTGDKA